MFEPRPLRPAEHIPSCIAPPTYTQTPPNTPDLKSSQITSTISTIRTSPSAYPPAALPIDDIPLNEYPLASSDPAPTDPAILKSIAQKWLQDFISSISPLSTPSIIPLLHPTKTWWRDHLALSWDLHTLSGSSHIILFLRSNLRGGKCAIQYMGLEAPAGASTTAPILPEPSLSAIDAAGRIQCIQVFFALETDVGYGRGLLRLVQDPGNGGTWKMCTLYTVLLELKGHPERGGVNRPLQSPPCRSPSPRATPDPTVVIVGAGHCGLATAARLSLLGIRTLLIDRQARTGDNWRLRYVDLMLHDPHWVCMMPYISYPPHWPVYASKDEMGAWLESYTSMMKLEVWNRTSVVSAQWEDEQRCWSVSVEREDGPGEKKTVVLRPRHIIQATGLAGEPKLPGDINGLESFPGIALHSSSWTGVQCTTSKATSSNVVVVGAGNSAHDIAAAYARAGSSVTMVQRSGTYVISLAATRAVMAPLYRESGPPAELSDLVSHSWPIGLRATVAAEARIGIAEMDRDLLEGYASQGYALSTGMKSAGLVVNVWERSGGYHVDIGCGELIASGRIRVCSNVVVDSVRDDNVVLSDGTVVQGVDTIIFATGFQDMRNRTAEIFGQQVAARVGPVWGLDAEGEVRSVWRPLGLEGTDGERQEGLWIAAGNFSYARYMSRLLALQILARELELV